MHPTSFDIEDKEVELWDKYIEISSDNSIVKKFDSNVLLFFQNFNIQPTSKIKTLFSHKSKNLSQSSELINNYVFQMNISPSYFDICKYLHDIYDENKEKYIQISEQALPHIFRSFIIILHIFKIKINDILHERLEEDDQLYTSIITSLQYFIDFFLKQKNETFNDGLYLIELLFHKISPFFPQICKNITSPYFDKFPLLIQQLITCITQNEFLPPNSISPFLEFIGEFYHFSFLIDVNDNKDRNECLITFFSVIIKYSSILRNLTDRAYWSLTSFLLSYLDMLPLYSSTHHNEEYFSLTMEILKRLYPFRVILIENDSHFNYNCINDTNFVKILSTFLISFIKNNKLKNSESKPKSENHVYSLYLNDLDIFDEFDPDYSKSTIENFNELKIVKESFFPDHSMNMICNQTFCFFVTNIDLLREFTKDFLLSAKDDNFLCQVSLYCSLIKSILKDENPENLIRIAKILDESGIWKVLLSTETIYEESFIISEENDQFIETRILIFQLVQIILMSSFTDYKMQIINSFGKLIETHSPIICSGVLNYLRAYLVASPEKVISFVLSDKSGLIKAVIKNDRYMKNVILHSNDVDDKQPYIQSHYDCFLMIKEICDNDANLGQILENDISIISYFYSYLFEKNDRIRLPIITYLTSKFEKIKSTHQLISTLTSILEQLMSHTNEIQNGQFLFDSFSNIINIYLISVQKNPKDSIKNILSSSTVQLLSNIPAYLIISYANSNSIDNLPPEYKLSDENEKNILIIIQYLIRLYSLMCKTNKSAFKLLNSTPNQEIITYSSYLTKYVKIDQSTYENFMSFLCSKKIYNLQNISKYRIVNFGGINFIYDWTYSTSFYKVYLKDLLKLSENSISNSYQLFKCGIKSRLLEHISGSNEEICPESYLLYNQIASFFSINDVKEILHAIIQSDKQYSIKLLEIFSTILNEDYSKLPNSFFHISGEFDNKLIISKLALHIPFVVSTRVLFEQNISKSTFMEITDEIHQLLIIVNNDETLSIEFNTGSENKMTTDMQINYKSNHWHKLKIIVNYESIEFYLDKKLQLSYSINHIEFKGNNAKIQFVGEKCNIDDIKVKDLKLNKKIANFTAKLLHSKSNKIFNTIESPAKARFNGIYAPYSPRLIESVISCGGPKILLPLFTVVSKSINPSEFLRLLLVSFHTFLKKKEESFIKINFFRVFSHLLSSIQLEDNLNYFPLNCSNEIIGIFNSITNIELKEEMINYFWSDFALCAKFEKFVPFFYVDNQEKIQNCMTIQRCTVSIDYVDSPVYIDSLVTLLIFMFDKKIDDENANFLLTVISMKSIGETCGIIFLQVISHFVQSKNNSILLALKNHNYFSCFNSLIDLANETKSAVLTLWITRSFLVICHIVIEAKSNLCNYLLKLNFLKSEEVLPSEKVDELFDAFSEFLFDSENSFFQIPFYSIKLKKEGIKGLRYVQFIPLICYLFKFLKKNGENHKIQDFLNSLYSAFFIDVINYSHLIFTYLPDWYLWILFLMQNDEPSQMKRWIQIFAFVFKLDLNQFENMISLLYIFASLNQISFTDLLFETLNLLTSRNQKTETDILSVLTNQQILLIFKLMVFQPQISTVTVETDDKSDFEEFQRKIIQFRPKIELDTEIYTSTEILIEKLNKLSNFAFLLMNHICDQNDTKLISFSRGSPVTIGNLIVILLSKLVAANSKASLDIVKKILTNSDTNDTFIRVIHLSIVHYFKSNDEIIQIVKKENPEFKDATKEMIVMTSELMLEGFTDSMNKYIAIFPSEFEKLIQSFIESTKLSAIECDAIENNLADEQIIMYYMKVKNYNGKLWNDMYDEMKLEASNVWSVPDISNHRKFSERYDLIGRHLHTKRNKTFVDHLDASKNRDDKISAVCSGMASFLNYEPIEAKKKTILSILNIDCRMLTVEALYIGTLFVERESKSIIFESNIGSDPIMDDQKVIQKVITIDLSTVRYILWRRYRHVDNSIEFIGTKSYFFTFQDNKERQILINELEKVKFMFPNIEYIQNKPSSEAFQSLHFTDRWKSGDISNFEYLFWVNMFSGRSYCDISQYPIYPWIIKDYSKISIDLNDPEIYRDLSRPIGTLNEDRLSSLKELKMNVEGTENHCLYRFHYSTASYVIYYLIRCEPFTSMHINLQKNRFDSPQRLFRSIENTWNNVISISMDFKELIPEFFTLPSFLLNTENYDLGVIPDTNERVNDVVLPKWSKSASQFIALHRLALESPIVSSTIDQWIDLIFGYKQRGTLAEEFLNDFHPYTYSSALDSSGGIRSPEEISTIQSFAANFGIVPEQLFKEKHPHRSGFLSLSKNSQISSSNLVVMVNKTPIIDGKEIVKISIDSDHIYAIDTKCQILKFKKLKDKWSLVETSPSLLNFELSDSISEHLSIIPSSRLVLISAPWIDKFSLFKMKSKIAFVGNSFKAVFTSPKHNSCISVVRADGNIVAIGTQNAGVKIWDIKKSIHSSESEVSNEAMNENYCQSSKLLIGHSSPIVDISIDESMDTLISIDKSKVLICFSISTGKQIFSMKLNQNVQRIFLSKLGFIITVSEVDNRIYSSALSRRSSSFSMNNNHLDVEDNSASSLPMENSISTSIFLYDLSGRLVESTQFAALINCIELIETLDCSEFIACSFDNGTFALLRVFDLVEVFQIRTLSKISLISFSKKDMQFVLKLSDNIVTADLVIQ